MKIRCKHCGEFFCPSDESVDLISEGYISSDNVNICDDCWEMINQPPDDLIEMISDADPGL
jgi:Pyruvate/2-oxoacid:ferredoxin oxidoreductase delta subunit